MGNTASGIFLAGATDVHVGGIGAGEGNVIAGNGADGVSVGFGSFPNPILGNSIFANGDLGIDLIGFIDDGVTPNDPGDGDTGANLQQNFPIITGSSGTSVSGTLNSLPGDYRIEVFANSGAVGCDAGGNGEGEIFLGATTVTITDSQVNTPFTVLLSAQAPLGALLTATATDSQGNTSEFSLCATPAPKGSIVVRKQTRPAGMTQSFAFTTNYGSGFSLQDGQSNTSGLLAAGSYSVTEAAVSGWDSSASCDDGSAVSAIDVRAGETVTCTFVNTQRGRIIVKKSTQPGGSQQLFTFSPSYGPSFQLADGGSNDSGLLPPGSYSVVEGATSPWQLVSATCDNGDSPTAISLAPGLTVTCTFMNGLPSAAKATLEVVKRLSPKQDPGRFDLAAEYTAGGTIVQAARVGDHGTTGRVPVQTGQAITVSETASAGTSLANYTSSVECHVLSGPDAGLQLPIVTGTTTQLTATAGNNYSCFFTNIRKGTPPPPDQLATLEVLKVLSPAADPGKFNLIVRRSGGALIVRASNIGNGGTTRRIAIPAGQPITIEETASGATLGNYTSTLSCRVISGPDAGQQLPIVTATIGVVTSKARDNYTCTFNNTRT